MRNFFQALFRGNDRSEKKDPEGEVQTAIAALLMEMANADEHFSDKERALVTRLLKDEFSLQSEEVERVMEQASHELHRRLDMYYFTNLINEYFDKPQKTKIMEAIWQVIYTDGQLGGLEDLLVHRFANLLRLDHSDMIAARLKIKANAASHLRKK